MTSQLIRCSKPTRVRSALGFAKVALLLLLVGLSACGFAPRREFVVPADLGAVRVVGVDSFSRLSERLAVNLSRAGAAPAAEGMPATIIRISAERWHQGPLTVDAAARVQEFVISYSVDFDVIAADGSVRVPKQTVELSRDFTFDTAQAIGTPGEEEVVRDELSRAMPAALMRRLSLRLEAD
ncbi:MAG: hypothetical protein CVV12_09125 [Gammaproteobacteria bacterium HGW-Gammaproteobacteria-2]|jgi:LPS-assembly lipoprotein|nr:MAG: hypothetical protein CVV12_09125 [Gammaproteobacteria bacterium HGW-Gammaproteobacteria-2]